eukprot:gene10876-12690_t
MNLRRTEHAVVREYRLYTIYQGVLVSLRNNAGRACVFKERLAHYSWYDVEVCVEVYKGGGNTEPSFCSFLTSKVYCTVNPPVLTLSSLLKSDRRLAHSPWSCKVKDCKHENYSRVRICKKCHTHNLQSKLGWVAMVPGLNIPFGIAVAVLKSGKACITKEFDDIVEAFLETLLAATNIALAPLFVTNIVLCFSRIIAVNGASTLGEFLVKFPYKEAYTILFGDEGLKKIITNRVVKCGIIMDVFDSFARVQYSALAAQPVASAASYVRAQVRTLAVEAPVTPEVAEEETSALALVAATAATTLAITPPPEEPVPAAAAPVDQARDFHSKEAKLARSAAAALPRSQAARSMAHTRADTSPKVVENQIPPSRAFTPPNGAGTDICDVPMEKDNFFTSTLPAVLESADHVLETEEPHKSYPAVLESADHELVTEEPRKSYSAIAALFISALLAALYFVCTM